MLVHLPGAFRAAQIFGDAYESAPMAHQYAMELMALAVDRDESFRCKGTEEIGAALADSRRWAGETLQRYPSLFGRWLPEPIIQFLKDRPASEILVPPVRRSEPPTLSRPPIQRPSRLPLRMWRERELQPLLAEWGLQVDEFQRLLDDEERTGQGNPMIRSAVFFYETARAALRLAYSDELTGLKNRHELERLIPIFEANLARKRRNAPTDYFLMVDIDHFKRVNDTYGHDAGDVVLQRVAKALFHVRDGDYVFRHGGEEFLMFLSNVGDRGIRRIAQRVRREISDLRIAVPGRSEPIHVTVSVGVARFRMLNDSDLSLAQLPKTPADRAIKEADLALYQAKERGRNRVVYSWNP